jgi:lipoyl(octanoyl) transferase
MRVCEVQDLGRISWSAANARQSRLVEQRRAGRIPDQLLLCEHPPVVTLGRNAKPEHVLASPEILRRAGIAVEETNRGGGVTFHGPGQLVAYPILDLNEWKRDVRAYVQALEETVIRTLAEFGIAGERSAVNPGVWVREANGSLAKICAVGVHISRWVTSHGLALNVSTDLDYFRYIVPCGLPHPVTSMKRLGVRAAWDQAAAAFCRQFASVFERRIAVPETVGERIP